MFGSRTVFSGLFVSNSPNPDSIKSMMAAARHQRKFRIAISLQRFIRSTSCLGKLCARSNKIDHYLHVKHFLCYFSFYLDSASWSWWDTADDRGRAENLARVLNTGRLHYNICEWIWVTLMVYKFIVIWFAQVLRSLWMVHGAWSLFANIFTHAGSVESVHMCVRVYASIRWPLPLFCPNLSPP